MARIVIVTESDFVWALPVWERAIPVLRQGGHEVVGLWTCPATLAKLRGGRIALWYLTHFGLVDFIKLGCLASLSRLRRAVRAIFRRAAPNFQALAKYHGVAYGRCTGPNDAAFLEWLRSARPDILVIWVGEILKTQVLSVPTLGCINKHASLLPGYKGIFPYLWAFSDGAMQGVTFHRVTESVDEGDILFQQKVPEQWLPTSMVRFYLETYRQYPTMLLLSIDALVEGRKVSLDDSAPSYFGLPAKQDIERFRKCGGHIVRWQDIFAEQ